MTSASTTRAHTLTLPWVERATSGFVYCDDMRQAVSLALVAGVNLIFSGPGGHAKSEFLETVFGAISGQETYVKSFGQGTSTEELFGGIDFDALNRAEGATLCFKPELSFLSHQIAIFEELFDAPSRVLTFLKDTLTAKELRNGHQRFPMATRVIAAATNHSPQEIAEGGPEIEALIQRFPIQLEVKWLRYDEQAFMHMFTTVLNREDDNSGTTWNDIADLQSQAEATAISLGVQNMLAKILVELKRDKVPISPRTAIVALKLIRAAAAINGRKEVVPADIKAIAFLPDVMRLRGRINELIAELTPQVEAEQQLLDAERMLESLKQRLSNAASYNDFESIMHSAHAVDVRLSRLAVSADQAVRRNDMRRTAQSLADAARKHSTSKLDEFEADYTALQARYSTARTVSDWSLLCNGLGHILQEVSNLPAPLDSMKAHKSRLIDRTQSLLNAARNQLAEARLAEDVDRHRRQLHADDAQIRKISNQLSRAVDSQARRNLMNELNNIETRLKGMRVHPQLQSTLDAILSMAMVVRQAR